LGSLDEGDNELVCRKSVDDRVLSGARRWGLVGMEPQSFFDVAMGNFTGGSPLC
jgi:hypothetical protein